jgi:ATP-binding cassette subfamily B protein RaxB
MLSSLRFGFGRSLPLILQSESAECGLACLAMVAGFHGYSTDLISLRQRYSLSLRGCTLQSVVEIADDLDLSTRAVRIELADFPFLTVPAILHWNMNHFVVLKKVNTKANGAISSIVIHDPAKGECKVALDEISRCFTGIAVELVPTSSFEPKQVKQQIKLTELFGRVVGLRSGLIQIIALALALEVFALTSPFFMQLVVDGAILSADRNLLSMLAIGFALLMVLQTSIALFRSWTVIYLSTHLNLQWVRNVFSHLLRLPLHYFEKRHLGDVVSRFNAIHTIQLCLTTSFAEAILDGMLAIAVLCMMLVYSPSLSALVLISLSVYLVFRLSMYGVFRRASEEQLHLQGKEQSLFFETLRGIQCIKLFNHENARRTRWFNALAATTNRGIATQKMNLAFTTFHSFLVGLENILIIWLGARLVMENTFSVGMLFAFISYKTTFTGRVYSLIDKSLELKMLSLQGERLADIVLAPREPGSQGLDLDTGVTSQAQRQLHSPTPLDMSIEVRNLSFRFSDAEPWVIKNINLTIAAGESVALIGPSGCGKTTFLKILLGLLEPSEGEVLLGGVPLNQLGSQQYRNLIGAVMQDDQLLSGSLADNISFFTQTPDFQWVQECAAAAAIANEIQKMPMKYLTLVGDMGTSLSGGQKQRVLLARALYKRPQILFLDEATSHLDLARESEINHTIHALALTRIIVAHRPETIKSAGRVVELFEGKIVRDLKKSEASEVKHVTEIEIL